MDFIEIFLIALGLSMDAVAVSTTNGLSYPNLSKDKRLAAPLLFGLFQAGMPCLGYFAGGLFSDFITRYAGVVVLIILSLIGGNMMKESLRSRKEDCSEGSSAPEKPPLPYRTLMMQAVATSIDAFAVGVSFSATHTNLAVAASVIGLTTCVLSLFAYFLGRKSGPHLGGKAEFIGGLILVMIGIKSVF